MYASDVVRNSYKNDKVVKEDGAFKHAYVRLFYLHIETVGESKRQNNRTEIDFSALDSVGVSFGDS